MNIHRGDRGAEVKTLQAALKAHGFNLGDDGIFGPGVEQAVRTFQQREGLHDDGIAGRSTLQALGIAPDTLQPLSLGGAGADSNPGSGTETITFTEDGVTVPPVVEQRIREFASKVVDSRSKLLTSASNALAQFETTMSFASEDEANPDVLGALVSTAISKAVDSMIEHVPVLSEVKPYYDAVTQELERAGRARNSREIGDWIKDQRAVIDDNMQNVKLDDVVSALEEGYLDLDPVSRQTRFQELSEASQSMDSLQIADIDELECEYYEQWINAHYDPTSTDLAGFIEFRNEYSDGTFSFVSCEVKAPYGDKTESGLNRLFDRGRVLAIGKPIDLRVRKYGNFYVEDLVPGGHDWSGGWLDADNQVTDTPTLPEARKAFDEPGWRQAPRFKRD